MSDSVVNILVLLNRYLHIVSTTLLVGGTLFYEMVVPVAISELKPEQQLSVFGRARWVFRSIVLTSAVLLLITGIFSTQHNWPYYAQEEFPQHSAWVRAGWWWAAHASTGLLAVIIAVFLTISRRPPTHPIPWMRLNLVILLLVIFVASTTRHMRRLREHERSGVPVLRSLSD